MGEMWKKDEEEKEGGEEIVVKVDMHCEACARKVLRSLHRLPGVEEVKTDMKRSRVVVRGKEADPAKVMHTLLHKCGRSVQLLSPPSLPINKEQPPPPHHSKNNNTLLQPLPLAIVVLSVRMHCEACAQVLQKRVRKIKGVESVETNLSRDEVIVRGRVEPSQLVSDVYKKTRKQAAIVKEELDSTNKDDNKEEKKKDGKEDEEKEIKTSNNKGDGGEEEEEAKKKKKSDENIKRIEHSPSKYYTDYAYAPQIFSDENPNACVIM